MSEFESQILWVTVKGESDKTYYITSEKMRDMYYLWTDSRGKPKLTKHQNENPLELYKYCK